MAEQNQPLRFVFILILIAIVGWLGYFSYKKNSESESRAQSCQAECSAQGQSGFDFRWNVLSGPQCRCIP